MDGGLIVLNLRILSENNLATEPDKLPLQIGPGEVGVMSILPDHLDPEQGHMLQV